MAGKANRGGSASAALTRLVIETYGPACHLRLAGCTRTATTKDHLVPFSHGGDDSLENLRPACNHCNSKRRDKALAGYGVTVVVLIGPPASGKTTYVLEHAEPGDLTIDLDALTRALMPHEPGQTHQYPAHIRHVAIGARKAAIDRAIRLKDRCTVWLIHAIPSPAQLQDYRRMRYRIIVVDPGRDIVEPRVFAERPPAMLHGVAKWYETYPDLASQGTTEVEAIEHEAPAPAAVAGVVIEPSRVW